MKINSLATTIFISQTFIPNGSVLANYIRERPYPQLELEDDVQNPDLMIFPNERIYDVKNERHTYCDESKPYKEFGTWENSYKTSEKGKDSYPNVSSITNAKCGSDGSYFVQQIDHEGEVFCVSKWAGVKLFKPTTAETDKIRTCEMLPETNTLCRLKRWQGIQALETDIELGIRIYDSSHYSLSECDENGEFVNKCEFIFCEHEMVDPDSQQGLEFIEKFNLNPDLVLEDDDY